MTLSQPAFIGIGAQKSGTTYIFEALHACNRVKFPAVPGKFPYLQNTTTDGVILNTYPKEIQFVAGSNIELSWEQYLNLFADVPDGEFGGEISPSYMSAQPSRIAELAALLPGIRLFAIFRNPIERDWSAIRMIADRRGELDDDEALMDICQMPHVLDMGDYAGSLKNWLKFFPREQFYFCTTDELESNARKTMTEILLHIGATEADLNELPYEKVFQGPLKECPARLRDMLRERHEDKFAVFETLTGINTGNWLMS
jgi:hypothetical protein